MKSETFLRQLYRGEKIKLTEPSEIVSLSYIDKSESNIKSAKILLENDCLEESTSLLYYSMYNNLLGLLFKVGIKSENHTASIILLDKIFDLGNNLIFQAKEERIDKQYYLNNVSKNDVEEMIAIAEEFNKNISEFMIKMPQSGIEGYRKEFEKLMVD